MNITGPIQSNLNPIQDSVEQFLKVNQRIAGEVLHISNEQVVLAVNGVQIVAKMTSSEQLALLMDKRYAYFTVKDISDNQITLQLTNPVQNANTTKTGTSSPIGQALLEQIGLAVDNSNLVIVQAALNRGLKITPELVDELRQVLEALPQWGNNEAQLAAAIKSAGLPLTEGSLTLAQNSIKELKTNFTDLYTQLNQAINQQNLSPKIAQSLRLALDALQSALIQGADTTENLENNLKTSVRGLGISLENEIGKFLTPGSGESLSSKMSGVLFTLANLRHELGNANTGRLGNSIDNFIQGMRWMHFVNAEPDQPVAKGQWTQLDLPISFGYNPLNRLNPDNVHNLEIRVAHDSDEESGSKINPDYTRLVIQVDIENGQTIKVDLSIVSHMIGADITASSDELCVRASEELDDLKTGLTNLGYTLKASKVELGNTILEMDMNESGKSLPSISSVDIGV
jgi:hypothetical protein